MMGEEISLEEVSGSGAISLDHHFKKPRLSPRAVDQASKLVPVETWRQFGVYSWLLGAAAHAFDKLPADKTDIRIGAYKLVFDFDQDGPFLKSISV